MNALEFEALAAEGLPHECQLLYVRVLRRYMDYKTGVVGRARRLTYLMMREVIEVVRPQRSKVPSQVYSQRQVRWFLEQLEAVGLVKRLPEPLVFHCCLATTDLVRPDVQRQYNGTTASLTTACGEDQKNLKDQSIDGFENSNSVSIKNSQVNLQRHTSVSPINSLSSLSTREKFSMREDWHPVDEVRVSEYLLSFGVDVRGCSDWQKGRVLDQFVSYWVNERPGVSYTQAVWEDKFCESALKVLRGKVN